MSDRDQQIEGLHQKASAHYLQGDTAGALASWRELLALRPDDERALEGVRLCEMLSEDSEPSFQVPGATDTDRPASATPASPPQVPDPQRQAEGLDLGDVGSTPTIGVAQTPAPPAPPAPPALPDAAATDSFDFDFSDTRPDAPATGLEPVPPAPAPVADGAALAGDAAAAELVGRTNELLAEATTAYEQGRREDALGLINRVFILDDDNSAARSLEEIIKAEVEAEQEPPAPTGPPAAEPGGAEGVLELDLGASEPTPQAAELEAVPLALAPTPEPAGDSPEEPIDLPDELEAPIEELSDGLDPDAEALPEPLPIPVKKKAAVPGWALIAVGLIVVVSAGAYFATGMLGADPAPAPTPEELMPTPAPELPADVLPPDDEPAVVHSPEEVQRLDALLGQAQTAFDRGDYAAAVIALGKALEIDPGNIEAQQQLDVAGERYREQKEMDRKWQAAIDSFNEGGYRNALTILYRLPAENDEEAAVLNRYRRNAWYNMGVHALLSSDCRGALSHFTEAKTLDATDEGVLTAVELAHRCGSGDRDYYRDLELLGERGLED